MLQAAHEGENNTVSETQIDDLPETSAPSPELTPEQIGQEIVRIAYGPMESMGGE